MGYQPEYIPLELCTHVIFKAFSFPTFVARQMLFNDKDKIDFSRLLYSVRSRSNTVRVVASIFGTARDFTATSATIVRRKAFVLAVASLLLEIDADAIELNWKCPGSSNAGCGSGLDRSTMITLLQDLRQAINSASNHIAGRPRELWFRGSLHPNALQEAYNIYDVCELVDHITLDPNTVADLGGVHAPLQRKPIVFPSVFGRPQEVINDMTGLQMNTQTWIDEGCPPKKLLFGVAIKGVRKTYMKQPSWFPGGKSHFGIADDTTSMPYNEACRRIRESGWRHEWDQYGAMPFTKRSTRDNREEEISYEDLNSLRYKMDMVQQKRLGGIYFDSVHSDDIYGWCGQPYALTAYLSSRVRSIPSDIGFAIEWN
ncbi:endochitinase-like [Anopheles nili]|uniref:endochitinase-like n=1 Tax=Anopheles nili TaxID=185578 RepID=UPI00237B91F8|nr:endochitinase-like [Anopheles nili]